MFKALGGLFMGLVFMGDKKEPVSEKDVEKLLNQLITDPNYTNPHGWPDENHYSTARDLAKLSQRLISNFPDHYSLYREKWFTYSDIKQRNRNSLLWQDESVDGIKTGFLTVEKYSLASSMKVGERRINAVASGFNTKNSRSRESIKLLNWGLRTFDTIQVAKKEETFSTIDVWLGKKK